MAYQFSMSGVQESDYSYRTLLDSRNIFPWPSLLKINQLSKICQHDYCMRNRTF